MTASPERLANLGHRLSDQTVGNNRQPAADSDGFKVVSCTAHRPSMTPVPRVRATLGQHSIYGAVAHTDSDSSFDRVQKEAGLMRLGRYRITQPSIALFHKGDHHVAHTVPTGAFITVDSATFYRDKLVEVTWDDQKVVMCTQDLRSRAEKVD